MPTTGPDIGTTLETFTWVPSTGSRGASRPRKLQARFGDGYMQEMEDGENNLLRPWDLSFDPIHATQGETNLNVIDDFLNRHAGVHKFLWVQLKPFDVEGPQLFVCEEWEFVYDRGLVLALRARFDQRPV